MNKTTALLALFASFSLSSADLTLQEQQYKMLMALNSTEMTQQEAMNTEGALAPIIPIVIRGAVAGGVLGAMGTVASNNNASGREIAIGTVGGAVAVGLTPVMGGTLTASVAAGGLGYSVAGACASCHL
ncbi:TPA: hypothetical protein RUZ63_003626 [Vibrio cholerae]|uniref:hypothetical protein n=1 Tax=Vibrio cholerae TaxID=666 RepID=UPI0011D81AD5|nr:hypothetical protein [Vibrio cholerae]EGR3966748.1 hypothetical protein [Vibrio cholerae]TXZ86072.1 hypothetical protein FXE50_15450 [Vibrio cholerae]TYA92543.1 hypothetical protein FXE19_06815 [Vibrio cholerae]GIB73139.1 hypothetical protein VCSRO19_0866 [Vibrio cholerae]HDZ9392379.1 hypothetical protein [Vibrio cholerae]